MAGAAVVAAQINHTKSQLQMHGPACALNSNGVSALEGHGSFVVCTGLRASGCTKISKTVALLGTRSSTYIHLSWSAQSSDGITKSSWQQQLRPGCEANNLGMLLLVAGCWWVMAKPLLLGGLC